MKAFDLKYNISIVEICIICIDLPVNSTSKYYAHAAINFGMEYLRNGSLTKVLLNTF